MRAVFFIFFAITYLCSNSAHAAMAPKFERVQEFAAAMEHILEASYLLNDPIRAVKFVNGEVHFVAGSCYVPLRLHHSEPPSGVIGGSGNYVAELGSPRCQ